MRLVLLAAAALVVVGCSTGAPQGTATTATGPQPTGAMASTTTTIPVPKEKAEDFAKRHLMEEAQGQWGLAYADLIPQQQATITRDTFIKCGEKVTIPQVTNIAIVKVYPESTPTPGAGDLDSTATTIKVTIQGGQSETQTVHAYNVNGSWRAAIDQANFDAQSKGQCAP